MEYLNGGIIKESEYELSHPSLFTLSNKLQVTYLQLPESLQKRLLDLEFDIFLHCNNLIDFYALRNFLIKNSRFHGTTTIAERVHSELALAKMLIESDIWSEYCKLPKRNFHFYRGFQLQTKIMDELRAEYEDSRQKQHQEQLERVVSESEDDSGKVSNDFIKQENSFFDGVRGKIEKVEKIVVSADTIVGTTLDFIKTLTSMGKFF